MADGGGGIVERLVVALGFTVDDAGARKALGTLGAVTSAVAAATAALAALSTTTAYDITRLANLGDSLGMTAQGAAEAVYAFGVYGAEINDVSDALQTLSDYSLEAINGTESFVDAFGRINIQASQLKGLKPWELLKRTADGFASQADVTKQAATASQLFGDDVGRKLLPLLRQGSKGIEDLAEEARIYSEVLDDDAVSASRELTHDLRRLGLIATGTGRRIGLAFMPAVSHATDRMVEWWHANNEVITTRIDDWVGGFADALISLDSPIGGAIIGVAGLTAGIRTLRAVQAATEGVPYLGTIGSYVVPLGKTGLAVAALALAIDDLAVAADGGDSASGRFFARFEAQDEFNTMMGRARDSIVAVSQAMWDLGAATGSGFLDWLDDINSYLGDLEAVRWAIEGIRNAFSDMSVPKALWQTGEGFRVIGESVPRAVDYLTGADDSLQYKGGVQDLAMGFPTLPGAWAPAGTGYAAEGVSRLGTSPTDLRMGMEGLGTTPPGSGGDVSYIDSSQTNITINGGDLGEVRRVVEDALQVSYRDAIEDGGG